MAALMSTKSELTGSIVPYRAHPANGGSHTGYTNAEQAGVSGRIWKPQCEGEGAGERGERQILLPRAS